MHESLVSDLIGILGDENRVLVTPSIVDRLSHDFYWYSPILKPLLEGKRGDVVVQALSTEDILAVLKYARKTQTPLTVRGAGTGNYGQCVPLKGGIVLDLSLMDKLEEITADGVAVCQPGLRLAPLETEARKQGWELRMYPSTLAKATVGGFVAGGSGGIGSVAHGGLRDFDNVRAIEVATMEEEPRIVLHEDAAVQEILHAWGTNGVITRIWFPLTPAVEWTQWTAVFPSFLDAFRFTQKIASSTEWTKRLATVLEAPLPSYFTPVKQIARDGQSMSMMVIARSQAEALSRAAAEAGGEVTFSGDYVGPRTQPLLTDYTWNHTTLWAMKADPSFTYLQCGFSPTECLEQFAKLRAHFGDEILFHIEFMKTADGGVAPIAIPVVRFSTAERLNEMIAYCRSIGVFVANPHVNDLEEGGRYRPDNLQLIAKQKYDPLGLMNPGKMASFEPLAVTK